MKGYYLFAPVEPECLGENSGVERKIRAQHKALSQYADCELVILPATEYKQTMAEKIIRRLPYTAAWRKWSYNGEFDDADFLYMRQIYHDHSFVRYLKAIKKRNPKIKIIYEIPTYPYDTESGFVSIGKYIFDTKDRKNRIKAAKYMDRIVTFYGQKEIWGVPCIDLLNGFDFSKVELTEKKIGKNIEIISVSTTAFWHGYDRMLEGINEYYKNGGTENIIYHLVGRTLPEIEKLIDNSEYLKDHVILHGKMFGEELAEIYKKSFIGIDILGGHRKDYPISSSLKSREYAAWGIPIITSSPVDYMPKDYKYQFMAPYDDSPVDVPKMLEFYHNVFDNKDCNAVAKEIRDFAVSKCDMSVAMKPVIDWLESK